MIIDPVQVWNLWLFIYNTNGGDFYDATITTAGILALGVGAVLAVVLIFFGG